MNHHAAVHDFIADDNRPCLNTACILMSRLSFAGRQRSSQPATERCREKVDAVSGIQSSGLPVGERRQDHRVRRHHSVHEAARTEKRGRRAAAISRGGREHRARRQPGTGCGVIPSLPST